MKESTHKDCHAKYISKSNIKGKFSLSADYGEESVDKACFSELLTEKENDPPINRKSIQHVLSKAAV